MYNPLSYTLNQLYSLRGNRCHIDHNIAERLKTLGILRYRGARGGTHIQRKIRSIIYTRRSLVEKDIKGINNTILIQLKPKANIIQDSTTNTALTLGLFNAQSACNKTTAIQ